MLGKQIQPSKCKQVNLRNAAVELLHATSCPLQVASAKTEMTFSREATNPFVSGCFPAAFPRRLRYKAAKENITYCGLP